MAQQGFSDSGSGPANVRVGIIGAGVMGTDHARFLHTQVAGAQVSGIADADAERATELARFVDAEVFADGQSLITSPDVDAVIIASADSTHHEYTMAAIAAQKPVLTEKPLAPTVAECREIVLADDEAARSGGSLVTVGFMRRFDPACVEQRGLVVNETYGKPLLLHCVSRGVSSGPGSTTESAISNSAVHEIDFVPWVLGSPVTNVSWQAPVSSRNAVGLRDPQLLTLECANGVIASCELFLNARYGHDVRSEIVFEEAAVATAEPILVTTNTAGTRSTTYGPDWRRRWADAYRIELQAWVDGLRGRTAEKLASARDGLAAALVVEALIASQRADGAHTPVPSVDEVLAGQ